MNRKTPSASIKLALLLASLQLAWLRATLADYVDASALKPSLVLIVPQTFKATTNLANEANHLQQVALVNNLHNERTNQLVRQRFPRLSLQVRDARSPTSGQLFYEHTFDYFAQDSRQQFLLLPLNLDQVSPVEERATGARTYLSALSGQQAVARRPRHLIVSVRPVKVEAGFGSESIELVSSAPVLVEQVKSADGLRSFAIVQTDKPIYKPTDKVRIRCLVVNENLRPVTNRDEILIQIKNPHRITVEEIRFRNETPGNASEPLFLDHTFEFPPEPMLGLWSLHLLHTDPIANDTTSFEVREYVLPTYEIEFESPKYILPSTQTISGAIVAKYHHGKPVQGKAHFKFGYKETTDAKPKFIARSMIKNIDPVTGRAEYKINSDKFKESDWFPNVAGYRFFVEATVTEMSTGHREISQDYSCLFISSPYKISFEDSIGDFKPGLSQQLTVQVVEAQTQRNGPPGLKISATYKNLEGKTLESIPGVQSLDKESFTDDSGRATFNVGPINTNTSGIQVTMTWTNSSRLNAKLYEQTVAYHTLVKHSSQSGWISFMNKSQNHLRVGDTFVSDLLIRDAVVMPHKIFFMIIAHGQILQMDTLNSDGVVSFRITEQMMPSIRVVLFALTPDSAALLSDSMRIQVSQDFGCGLKMSYKSNADSQSSPANPGTFRPNDKGKLMIQAREGDLVSLIGVDSAVYTLNNRSKLDSSRLVERIKKLDLGCGFGGGKDNLDVFLNAGLMLSKDVTDVQTENPLIGSACLTTQEQLKLLEDVQLGYTRPILAASQLSKPRASHSASLSKGRLHKRAIATSAQHKNGRGKRDIDINSILKKYSNKLERSCCRLGMLEDVPQRRNCSVRSQIVDRHMRALNEPSCGRVYRDCCRYIFQDEVALGSIVRAGGRDSIEMVIEAKVLPTHYMSDFSSAISLHNVGHLDRMETEVLTRKDFRETWLFDLVPIDQPDGSGTLDVQLPHSITSWSIYAMALNREKPMCIAREPIKIATFQEIFLHLSMPYKVIQGEQIDLVATVFNYSPQDQEVLVYMYGVEDICSEAEPGERSDRKRLRVEKHSSQSVVFPMIPLKIGSYPIKILAVTAAQATSDIVEQPLLVMARGKLVVDETTFSLDPLNQQRRSKRAIQTGNLVDEIDSSRGLQHSKIRLTPTRDTEMIVPYTQECIVSAIGDKMGQSLHTTIMDVENLIRLPHGCGEQVMIFLGPTLYTSRYLSSVNKLSGELRWRAVRYIKSGYRRILNFRKENGAFSAFAKREPSIWLTAFVTKMLCQTEQSPFIANEVHVDRTVINSALKWLLENQNEDTGSWVEMNPVYHREMLGGVLKENLLTAFVTVTLNECSHHSVDLMEEKEVDQVVENYPQGDSEDKLRAALNKAEQTLVRIRHKALTEKNPYVLALTAYALSSSKTKESISILNHLFTLADRVQSRNQLYWRGEYNIETAAYALQTLVELAPVISNQPEDQSSLHWSMQDAVSISNWLSSKRSYTGAFESTQDTVVALEALTKFNLLQASSNGKIYLPLQDNLQQTKPSLTCNVTVSNRTRRSIEFGKDNSLVLQTFKVDYLNIDPSGGEMIDVLTSGNGIGIMSVKLRYNVFQDEDELCRFDIDSWIVEWQPKTAGKTGETTTTQSPDELGDDRNQPGEGSDIDDDYFKDFHPSLLSELNLVGPINNLDSVKPEEKPTSSMRASSGQQHSSQPKMMLRMRRSVQPSHSSAKNKRSPEENWASKLVSSIKASLPSWLYPAPPTTTPEPTASALLPTPTTRPQSKHSLVTDKKVQTIRRSANTTITPIIVKSSQIPDDAKLNPLSKQIDVADQNYSNLELNGSRAANVSASQRLVLLLKVCVHHLSSRKDSEMAVIEIGIISGFKPNEADLKEIIAEPSTPAMKYELSPDKSMVIIYMQYIPYTGSYCLQFRLVRDSLVYNLQSGYIRVYEYYSPTNFCSNFYTPTRIHDLIEPNCDYSAQVCKCATKSLCPANNKLLDLSEIHSVNTSSARNQFIELTCSKRFDFVSLVRLKSVRRLEAGIFKLAVKVRSDLRGNLTKIMDELRHSRNQAGLKRSGTGAEKNSMAEALDEDESLSLDHLNLHIDSTCVNNDPFLLHLAHPNQWKQGGELMILFGRLKNLQRVALKPAAKSGVALRNSMAARPKLINHESSPESSFPMALFEDEAQPTQYSLTMQLDRESIFYDLTYQSNLEPRKTLSNLILWLEVKSRRDSWACPTAN